MAELIIVPTSHVAGQSVANVKHAIERENPDCVAVELDISRYHYLRERRGESPFTIMRTMGVSAFLVYMLLKRFQNYFGRKTGILPGSEMREAVEKAKEMGLAVAFVDQPIQITLLKIRTIPLREKMKLLWLLAKSVLGIVWPWGKGVEIDLNRVPSKGIIDYSMNYFRKELPNFYRVLVSERDEVMARNLKELSKKFNKIVCVIGAGHETGMKNLLKVNVKFKRYAMA